MKLLFLISSPSSAHTDSSDGSSDSSNDSLKSSLDAAVTSAAFGQQVILLFMGKGVQHLLGAMEGAGSAAGEGFDLESYEIETYGIEEVYFQSSACATQPLEFSHLNFAPRGLTDRQIGELLAAQTTVLHF